MAASTTDADWAGFEQFTDFTAEGPHVHRRFVVGDPGQVQIEDQEFDECEFRLQFPSGAWAPEGCAFRGCRFVACDLSMSTWVDCVVRDTTFVNSRLSGMDLTRAAWSRLASAVPLRFEECDLSYANFQRVRLGGAAFISCRAIEADFAEADLSGAVFDDTDLTDANFMRTDLSGADLRGAQHFVIDPTLSKVRGARFSSATLAGLLIGFGIEID